MLHDLLEFDETIYYKVIIGQVISQRKEDFKSNPVY